MRGGGQGDGGRFLQAFTDKDKEGEQSALDLSTACYCAVEVWI